MRWKTLVVLLSAVVVANAAVLAGDLSRVRALVKAGRSAEALADLDEHLEEFPVDPEAMFLRALLLAETQRRDEAREVFEEVSGIRPDRPEPLNNLAVIQAAMGNYDAAVETLKEALRTHPAYRTAYENLTKIYGQLASEAYSRALSVDQAHRRSSLELILLSEMVLPEVAPVQLAQAPAETLPSAVEAAVEIEKRADLTNAAPVGTADIPATPEQAIGKAMRRGRVADPVAPEPSELAALVEAWARAWSGQRVEDYLYFYGRSFRPEGDVSRGGWEQVRRARVLAPKFVKVSVAFLDFEASESNRALVRFNQSYESDTFSDVVTKTLELVRENGDWKIARESVDSKR